MTWWNPKTWFKKPNTSQTIETSLNNIKEQIAELQALKYHQEQLSKNIGTLLSNTADTQESVIANKRTIRRLHLEQQNLLTRTEQIYTNTQSMNAQMIQEGTSIPISALLKLLDQLEQSQILIHSELENAMALQIIENAKNNLLELTQIKPIAELGAAYPEHHAEIVGSTEDARFPSGHICSIIQQGYLTHDGSRLRMAKVLVAALPLPIKQNNEIRPGPELIAVENH